jgi:putative hydrolase of the HAD superfamily
MLNSHFANHGFETVKSIVFDAVGTLIYAKPSVAEVYQTIAKPFGWNGSMIEIQGRFATAFSQGDDCADRATSDMDQHNRWRTIVGRVFKEINSSVVDSIFRQLWLHFADPRAWELYPDASQVIDFCHHHNIPWYIASNFDSRLLQVIAGHSPLSLARRTYCSSLIGFEKPSRHFFDHIREQLNQPADELLMIGDDRKLDYLGAKNAGWHGLWLDREDAPKYICEEDVFRIRRLSEIVQR